MITVTIDDYQRVICHAHHAARRWLAAALALVLAAPTRKHSLDTLCDIFSWAAEKFFHAKSSVHAGFELMSVIFSQSRAKNLQKHLPNQKNLL
ncbi:MAG TPA: hypothetical protein PK461_04350 [Alcaligenes faecalis]|nr:hypothetical protein [Alcaligenes faecalis]